MSEQETQTPDEQTQEEVENLPAPSDPEHPDSEPEDPEADTDGPSDDDVTGADQEPDGGEGEGSGEPAQPEPGSPDTESRLDELTSQLMRAAKNYGKRVADIFGDDWQGCMPCPLCATDFPGILTPAPRSDEVIAAVRPIIGLPDLSTFKEDRFARACDRCNGLGKTLTGSRVPSFATMQCNDCKGTGFQTAEAGAQAPVANGHADVTPPPTHVDEEPSPALPEASLVALEQMLAAARNAGVGQ